MMGAGRLGLGGDEDSGFSGVTDGGGGRDRRDGDGDGDGLIWWEGYCSKYNLRDGA